MGTTENDVRANQQQFLTELKRQKKPYPISVAGIPIIVHPDVFPPATDTHLLAENLKVRPGTKVLDLTTGSGALAVIAGKQGAVGFAVDINPKAVANATENFRRYGVKFEAKQSDLFDEVPGKQFDLIIANGPYIEGEARGPLEHGFFGARNFTNRLFSEAPTYLKPGGRIYVAFAEFGDVTNFEDTGQKNGFNFALLGKKTSIDGERTYRLYCFMPGVSE